MYLAPFHLFILWPQVLPMNEFLGEETAVLLFYFSFFWEELLTSNIAQDSIAKSNQKILGTSWKKENLSAFSFEIPIYRSLLVFPLRS